MFDDADIRKQFPGYHIEIELYPSGGWLCVTGCSECGTEEDFSISSRWRIKKGENIWSAIEKLRLMIPAGAETKP